MFCPNCGANLEGTPAFCENCGARIDQATPSPQAQFEPQPQAQPQTQPLPQAPTQAMPGSTQAMPSAQGMQTGGYAPNTGYTPAPGPGYAPAPSAQAPAAQGSNAPFVLAIIALVTAVLGLFPVSIILAIIALVMNSGQKKRGETSTKQTPTFVMSLISLILSVIMAIATAVLGGAIWLAIMDEDGPGGTIEITSTPSSSSSSTIASTDLVGTWQAKWAMLDGEEFDEDYLDLMESYGGAIRLLCFSDGKVTFDFGLLDETMDGTWQLGDSNKVVFTLDGEKFEGTVSGGELTLASDEDSIVFKRTSSAEPTTNNAATASSASSASASSSSSSASTSSTSSEARPLSTQDVGRPSESDFSWVDGASGSLPQGAIKLTKGADVSGTWKMMLEYHDYDGSVQGLELGNLNIQAGDRAATITFDWYKNNFGDGWNDVKDDDVSMDGAIDAGEITASSSYGNVDLEVFYEAGGKQYGVGDMMLPSGETAIISLVRP